MPYISKMREGISGAIPIVPMSHKVIYGDTWTKKASGKVSLSKMGGARHGVPASTPYMGGKRFQ